MKKYLIILFLCFVNFYYSNCQNISDVIVSVYVDGNKIDEKDRELLLKIKKQQEEEIFLIQHNNKKVKFSISYSEINKIDSISVQINSIAKKRDVDIIESKKSGTMFVTRCIRCNEKNIYRSIVTLHKSYY